MTTATETRLYVDAIDAKPVDFDWSEGCGEGDSGWEIIYPDVSGWTPAQCFRWLDDRTNIRPDFSRAQTADDVIEAWRECVGDQMQASDYEPVMNYYYPLPELRMTPEAAQSALEQINTACVVALVHGDPVLALAGGGMDLSWDICRAYIALGYYPPVHFAGRLPGQGERDVQTAEIAAESCRIAARWAAQRVEDAERMLERTRELAAAS